MRWSIGIGRVFGIALRIHVTFLLLLAWVGWLGYAERGSNGMFWALLMILAIFACVGLHELGHSIVAQRLGVQVRSITFLPIGGVAGMKSIPEVPRHELAITVAGPLVNVVIALALIVLPLRLTFSLWPGSDDFWPFFPPHNTSEFLESLLRANILMVAFNLIPAFPMDGGRILRSLLAMAMRYLRATAIAVTVGQAIAVLFFLYGIYQGSLMLPIIGFFIFWGAEMEERMVRMRASLRDLEVDDVMNRQFTAVGPTDTIAHCLQQIYQTGQEDFPVLENGQLVGILTRNEILKGVHEHGTSAPVGAAMRRVLHVVTPNTSLIRAHEELLASGASTFPVMDDGQLVGMLSQENISRYFLLADEIGRRKK
jgi:Zn-dependent protease